MVQNLQKVGVLLAKHLGQQHTCHVAFPPDGRLERVAAVEERVGREVGRHSCHDWRQLVEIAAQHKLHASPGLSDLVALVPDPAHHPLHLEEKLARDHAYLVHHQRPQIAPLLPVPLFKHFPEVLHAHWDAAAGERVQGGAADVRGRDAGCRSDGQQAAVPAVPLAQHRHDVVEQERLAGACIPSEEHALSLQNQPLHVRLLFRELWAGRLVCPACIGARWVVLCAARLQRLGHVSDG
mmetsp:Transcript_24823/g.62544  ORF Transcript_24823/g.62544 Transcript_24823/m.62544 type:complete len:238 (-) Transcript_24823:79-792(-)